MRNVFYATPRPPYLTAVNWTGDNLDELHDAFPGLFGLYDWVVDGNGNISAPDAGGSSDGLWFAPGSWVIGGKLVNGRDAVLSYQFVQSNEPLTYELS